ncbi:MAG: NADH-quinone oxidoreductase subunit J [Bacteroidetes bacterium]|nr:NADH-quinone oxidoreductase subunit J [Fibrella sp.]
MIQCAFWGFASLTLIGALAILLTRNVLYAAFCLLLTLLGVAGLFVLASADFLAVAQIMIYVGGVLVLIIFGVMLTHKPDPESAANARQPNPLVAPNRPGSRPTWLIGLLVAGGLFVGLYRLLSQANFTLLTQKPFRQTTVGTIGIQLMTEYSLPFEIAGLLLLAALVGAAYLSSPKKSGIREH